MRIVLLGALILCMLGLACAQRAPCGIRYCPVIPGDKQVCAINSSNKEKVIFPNSCYMAAANDCNNVYTKFADGPCP